MFKNNNIKLLFQDEVHFQQNTTITRAWFKKSSKPTIKTSVGRNTISYSGYVSPISGELFTTKSKTFNFEEVIKSFRELIKKFSAENKKIVLVLDNAPWHRKAHRLIYKEKDSEYKDIRKVMSLFFIPPYSPDLNPIELCWKTTRKEVTHNRYFSTIKELEDKLDAYFKKYSVSNEKYKKLCNFNYKF